MQQSVELNKKVNLVTVDLEAILAKTPIMQE